MEQITEAVDERANEACKLGRQKYLLQNDHQLLHKLDVVESDKGALTIEPICEAFKEKLILE